MHTVWVRLNAVVFFSLSVLLTLALLASFTAHPLILGHNGNPDQPLQPIINRIKMSSLRSLRPHGSVDRALFSIDLNADFTPAFHWNVKQVFVFVVAEFQTKQNRLNQVVLWDKIIEADDKKIINEKNTIIKYSLISQSTDLRGVDVELKVYWDTMPITSTMTMGVGEEVGRFTLPSDYVSKAEKGKEGGGTKRKKRSST
ncbi:hypothetical protein TrLO_g11070 [Triparma laevis f. longispina]|uniref:Signal peptidase complex subunit 3 n=1 Tax=Triparma laevis f. longispina TaxID=1714387 RepID=A0A9W7FJ34_9STRA|nr:hypothetical protein TrLO_g11070 [Triparma laevis f. longispina]